MAAALEKLTALMAMAMALVAGGCARPPAAHNHVRLAVGGANQMVYLPTTLAQQLGYYTAEGLDVELQDFAGGSKSLEALVGGSADVVSGFYDHTIQMAAEGRHLTAFVNMLRYPGLVLVTSPQAAPSVTKIEDLKGRVAGVTSAGSSSQMLLTYLLQRHGVAPDSVSVTAIGSAATAIAAVERGKVDAGMMADPAFTLLALRTRDSEALAESVGIDAARYKTLAFVASCFFCGLMGAIHGHYLRFVSPFVFTFFFSTDLVIFNMVGGLGSFWGPLAGAVLLTGLGEQLFAAGYYKSLVYAIVLLVVILALPGGLIQLPRLREQWAARRVRWAKAPVTTVER